jgi:hypothetical protein
MERILFLLGRDDNGFLVDPPFFGSASDLPKVPLVIHFHFISTVSCYLHMVAIWNCNKYIQVQSYGLNNVAGWKRILSISNSLHVSLLVHVEW